MDRQMKILMILLFGVLMGALDATIVLLALPTLTGELHTTLFASHLGHTRLPPGHSRNDHTVRENRRHIRQRANVQPRLRHIHHRLPSLRHILDITSLIIFRIVQAVGGALLQANSGAIIADTFEPQKRGRAFGYTSVGWSVGAMLGILLGGALTTFVGWRYIFFINVPIGIAATYFCLKYIRDNPKVNSKIDWPGMATLTISLVALSYSAIAMAAIGVSNTYIAIFVAGLVALGLFLFVEGRSTHPLMNMQLFVSNRVLSFSILAGFFMSMGYLAVVFIIIMYLQGIRGLSPLDASLLLVPGYIVTSFIGPWMGRLSDKYGARILATLGLFLIMGAVLVYLTLSVTSNVYIVLVASFISGVGTAMFFPANSSAIMANADPEHYGSISGLSRLMQNIGTLSSYVIVFTIASLAVSRMVAFNIFIGTAPLIGGVSAEFLDGIHASLEVSFFILLVAVVLSFMRGKEDRAHEGYAKSH